MINDISKAFFEAPRKRDVFFELLEECVREKDRSVDVVGIGSVVLAVNTNRGKRNITIRNVLHCPDFTVDVLSKNQLVKEGFRFSTDLHFNGITTPQQLNVEFASHRGLDYLCGCYNPDPKSTLNTTSVRNVEQFAAHCVHTADTNALLGKLDEPYKFWGQSWVAKLP